MSRERDIIREGETCWRRVRAGRVALLLDAANYFGALRQSMLAAEHSILLAGWDIDSRTELRGDTAPDDDGPATLGPLLSWLVRRRPKLTVRILLWDYSMLYALEREVLPRLNLDWKTPRRVQVCLDNCLPFGSSHHEKLAVIDGCIAYCGGIDLTIRRWDRPAHDPADPDRRDPDGVAYAPFHDLQLVVDGDAARALDELLRERWNRAAGVRVEAVTANSAPWPDGVAADFRDIDLGIARTRPAWRDEAELRQVEAVFVDAIGRAQRLIYIENQYLTFPGVAAALGKRLEACPNLELIIVNPDSPGGWLEAQTMGQGRIRFLARLALAGQPDRVRVLYPWVKAGADRVAVMVHAKLMIVDDRLLQLGSSNLNCRSMGVDRECDLLIEAHDAAQRRAIRAIRCRLLAHHLGLEPETLSAEIDDGAALIPWLDGLASDQRGLAALPEPEADAAPAADWMTELADPEQPIDPEQFVGDLFGAIVPHPLRRQALRLLAFAAALAVALAVWRFSPLADRADPERIARWLEAVAASPWSIPIVLAGFVGGSFLVVPVTAMIVATAAALGPVQGFVWALTGVLLAAALNFSAGRLLPVRLLESWFGNRLDQVRRRLDRGGIVTIMIVRNLPVAPFSVVNVVAGAVRVRPRDFLVGTLLGMVPGIAALTLLGDRIREVWQDPGWLSVGLLAGALVLWVGIAIGLQYLSNRVADRG